MYKKTFQSPCPEPLAPQTGRSGKEAGFSFIELLIAISLMAFLIVGVLSMNSAYVKFNQSNRYYSTAVQLAENGIESYMRLPYADLEGKSDALGFGQIPGYANYTRRITVEDWNADTCTIRSRAAWRAGGSTNAVDPNHWPIELIVVRTSL